MSKIKSISAINLKGRTFSHDLASVNIICGDNFAGKTAELSAIRLVLLGYDPKKGRTAGATFSACGCPGGGATQLAVTGKFEDGTTLARSWTMKKSKISYEGPDDTYIPPLLLDPTTYFDLTGPARLNYVLSQCDVAALGLGCAPLVAKLTETLRPLNTSPAAEASIQEVLAKLDALESKRVEEDASPYEWLTAVVEDLDEIKKAAVTTADTHEQTVRGLVDNKAGDGDMSVNQSVQADLNAVRDQLTTAVQAEANALNAFTEAERKVQEARTAAAKAVDVTAVREKIEVEQRRKQAAEKVQPPGNIPKVKVMDTPRPTDTLEQKVLADVSHRQDAVVREANDAIHEVKRLEQAVADAQAHTNCPTCGHDITDKQKKVVKELREQLKVAQGVEVSKSSIEAVVSAQVQKATEACEKVAQEIDKWDALRDFCTEEYSREFEANNAKVQAYNAAQAEINHCNSEIARLESTISGNIVAEAAAELVPKLVAESAKAGEAYRTAKAALQPLRDRITTLDGQQRRYIARTQDARRSQQSRDAHTAAAAKVEILKAALKLVATEKARVATDAFNNLLEHARLFTDGILKAPLQYLDGELGMTWRGNWVSYRDFSGVEEKMAFAGLAVALTRQSKSVTKLVMMDELGVFDPANKIKLVDRMLKLTSTGVIDTFVGCDVSSRDYPASNGEFEIIQVDAAA